MSNGQDAVFYKIMHQLLSGCANDMNSVPQMHKSQKLTETTQVLKFGLDLLQARMGIMEFKIKRGESLSSADQEGSVLISDSASDDANWG
ncbi:hypothetical protein HDU97_010128 [Phlyctochytrium planicorne]|nr:hypothetical protein HDU97_010128 [Phlyctochytrium planicorne]